MALVLLSFWHLQIHNYTVSTSCFDISFFKLCNHIPDKELHPQFPLRSMGFGVLRCFFKVRFVSEKSPARQYHQPKIKHSQSILSRLSIQIPIINHYQSMSTIINQHQPISSIHRHLPSLTLACPLACYQLLTKYSPSFAIINHYSSFPFKWPVSTINRISIGSSNLIQWPPHHLVEGRFAARLGLSDPRLHHGHRGERDGGVAGSHRWNGLQGQTVFLRWSSWWMMVQWWFIIGDYNQQW